MFKRPIPFLLAAALLLLPALASAQQNDRRVRTMISGAMEQYQNLDVDAALQQLQLAQRLCANSRCSGAVEARIHVAIGVVSVGGQNNATAGVDEFTQALRLDPNAAVDPTLETPEITAAFTQARQRAGNSGGGGGGGTGIVPPNNGGGGGGGGGNTLPRSTTVATLLHTPAPEQLENTPLPVYIEHGAVQAARFVVHYRGLGMSGYSTVNMESVANGYGAEVPCGQVIAPYVEYYVTAENDGNQVVGAAGTPQAPTRVTIVRARTQPAPALPGRMPREQCGEDCPPGMGGPQCRSGGGGDSSARGQRQMGDPCTGNNQCGEGLHCQEGSCAPGEEGGGGPAGPQANFYRFGIDFGGGIGFAYLGGTPTYAELRDYDGDEGNGGGPYGRTCGPPREGTDPNDSGAGTLVCPGSSSGGGLSPGFAPTGYLLVNIRFNILRWFGVGATVRFQPDSAPNGLLPFMLIGLRGYVAFTPNGFARNGLVGSAFAGGGFGQIQPRPPISCMGPCARQAAHVASGLTNAHAGARIEYGIANILHFGAEFQMNLQFTSLLFDADLHGFAGLHF